MKAIRAGMGLGDALYLQSVVRHLALKGQRLEVRTEWPDVFRPLNGSVSLAPFSRAGAPIVAHYTSRKGVPGTTQFQDSCMNAGIRESVEMKLDWKVQNTALVERVRQAAELKPIVLVQLMRPPMNRRDRFGASLLPNAAVMQSCVDRLRLRAFTVLVGSGVCVHPLKNVDLDLSNQTSVSDLLDVSSIASAFFGYVSFFVPLAESFGKPAFFVWSHRGLDDAVAYVRNITPEKVLHRKDLCRFVVDSWPTTQIEEALDAFRF